MEDAGLSKPKARPEGKSIKTPCQTFDCFFAKFASILTKFAGRI